MRRSFLGLRNSNSNSYSSSIARLANSVYSAGQSAPRNLPRPISATISHRYLQPREYSPTLAAIQCRFSSSQTGELQAQKKEQEADITARTMNGASTKRKASLSSAAQDRPPKQRFLVQNGGVDSPGLNTPDVERIVDDLEETEILAPYFPAQQQPDTAEWQATVENVIRNVVSIRFCQTAAFDTDAALTSEATGFVVDAEKGYVQKPH